MASRASAQAEADGGVSGVVAYVFGEAPAAFALRAFGGFGLNVEGSLGDFASVTMASLMWTWATRGARKDAVVALEDGVVLA